MKKFDLSTPHLRPKKYSTDNASTLSVVNFEVKKLEKKKKFTIILSHYNLHLHLEIIII